ncbi:pantoate--beta-alanine ligase [Pectinatus haikarae]|uniref:pantoate--beta-alanine ligase n=1 Tax=Pectinatus haikarae TaxID=349096 RepID=UPI0018C56B4F|nr:pantoate--beta-alanine ligase [Pectinatus haikarae]
MILCTDVKGLRKLVKDTGKKGKTIGLVPTMGALHEGHISLITACSRENDLTIVSIFVNPVQFGPNEDFGQYPRDLSGDCQKAEAAGADIIFAPDAGSLYPGKDMTWVETTGDIVKVLCGRTRPIHFRGVTTIIAKLFNITMPDKAYFGQKDAQQVEVIRKMVNDLFFDVELHIMPIVREQDGLAKSSRNIYLNKEERQSALVLYKSLKCAQSLFLQGEKNLQTICSAVHDMIAAEPLGSIEYVESYLLPGLIPANEEFNGRALVAVAVRFGTTRLIDNVILGE